MSERYTEEEWLEAVDGSPMAGLSDERFLTLHRHWIWADSAFRWFERELARQTVVAIDDVDLASDRAFSMYLWYSLLIFLSVAPCAPIMRARRLSSCLESEGRPEPPPSAN